MDDIADALARVRERIARAAERAQRDPDSIRLVAVSKTKPAEDVRRAYLAGQRDFGENYVQELIEKAAELTDLSDLRWHLVGHLQRNKVKSALDVLSCVHSLDSTRLARELGKRAAALQSERESPERLSVLVEVNVGGESQKSGVAPAELGPLLETIEQEPALRLAGLMAVPPQTPEPAESLPFFEELARLRERHGGAARLPELSMGMTHDLEFAIEAGATIVRVGTAIFGLRNRTIPPE
ncbi:MAG TPA: YggS family pyridoxal phosphate-dependent enzyme [Polyangiaceae bacterium]|nr:YggS family pyridoxal phosphate-dependent enzyme [Polyangiaceae bacterium]